MIFASLLKDNYLGLIQDVLMHASGQLLKVKFKVAATQPGATSAVKVRRTKRTQSRNGRTRRHLPRPRFNPKNTFDTLSSATTTVSPTRGAGRRPGPRQILQPALSLRGRRTGQDSFAARHRTYVREPQKSARVAYVSSEKFTNEYIDAIQTTSSPASGKSTGRLMCS